MVQYHEIVTAHMEGLTLDHESCYGRPVTRATMKSRLDVSTIQKRHSHDDVQHEIEDAAITAHMRRWTTEQRLAGLHLSNRAEDFIRDEKKACLYIHQVYPYFYLEYLGDTNPSRGESLQNIFFRG